MDFSNPGTREPNDKTMLRNYIEKRSSQEFAPLLALVARPEAPSSPSLFAAESSNACAMASSSASGSSRIATNSAWSCSSWRCIGIIGVSNFSCIGFIAAATAVATTWGPLHEAGVRAGVGLALDVLRVHEALALALHAEEMLRVIQ